MLYFCLGDNEARVTLSKQYSVGTQRSWPSSRTEAAKKESQNGAGDGI